MIRLRQGYGEDEARHDFASGNPRKYSVRRSFSEGVKIDIR